MPGLGHSGGFQRTVSSMELDKGYARDVGGGGWFGMNLSFMAQEFSSLEVGIRETCQTAPNMF